MATAPEPAMTRDVQALRRFEAFMFSAIATVLVIRGFLAVTGYPQVGGGDLHVAHVLYGGLLMGIAIALVEVLPGSRWRVRSAYLGGIGFGLFIDEVGKFLTKDVNYFYKPAVAVMYAVFVLLYLGVRELLLGRPFDDRQRLAVAATALVDQALGQLDAARCEYALRLLDGVRGHPQLRDAIRSGLQAEAPQAHRAEQRITMVRNRLVGTAADLVRRPGFTLLLLWAVVLQLVVVTGEFIEVTVHPALGASEASPVTDTGAALATALSALYLLYGGYRVLRGDHQGAIQVLFRSVLVTLLFTQLLVFARYQWSGLLGFGLELLVLAGLHLAGTAERLRVMQPATAAPC